VLEDECSGHHRQTADQVLCYYSRTQLGSSIASLFGVQQSVRKDSVADKPTVIVVGLDGHIID
jgi:hypothetical protein